MSTTFTFTLFRLFPFIRPRLRNCCSSIFFLRSHYFVISTNARQTICCDLTHDHVGIRRLKFCYSLQYFPSEYSCPQQHPSWPKQIFFCCCWEFQPIPFNFSRRLALSIIKILQIQLQHFSLTHRQSIPNFSLPHTAVTITVRASKTPLINTTQYFLPPTNT